MAALTDAMKWYNLGGLKAARTKYHFKVEFFSSKYTAQLGGADRPARLIFDALRTIELPKYSIETEVANAYNVRQLIPTKIVFEPISISFTDTLDNRFQKFIKSYMNIISGSFTKQTKGLRKEYDDFGLKLLDSGADCPIDRIEITRFYGADQDRNSLSNKSKVTLWRPKIVDVQHDTLDYSASEAITWQISLRYESVTYEEEGESNLQASSRGEDPDQSAAKTTQETDRGPVDPNARNADSGNDNSYNALREAQLARESQAAQAASEENRQAAQAAAANQAAQAEENRQATEAASAAAAQEAAKAREEAKAVEPTTAVKQESESEYESALTAKRDTKYELDSANSRLNYAEGRLKQLEERGDTSPERLAQARQRVTEAQANLDSKKEAKAAADQRWAKANSID